MRGEDEGEGSVFGGGVGGGEGARRGRGGAVGVWRVEKGC